MVQGKAASGLREIFGCRGCNLAADGGNKARGCALFPLFSKPSTKGIVMKRQWIPFVAAALFIGTMTVHADGPVYLPATSANTAVLIVHAPAPEPVAAPEQPMSAPAPAIVVMPDCCCCPDQPAKRQPREHFNLCDYWEILCACFYHG
jgi:hypothetical protein